MVAEAPPRRPRIEVHTLSAPERRMLLEMLASERSGEDALYVGEYNRDEVAQSLCELDMVLWVASDEIVFTEYGYHVAERLAAQLITREHVPLS